MIDPPSRNSGSAFWTVKSSPLTLMSKILVEVLLGDRPERGELAAAGVGEQDVDPPVLLLDRRVEPVEVGQVRDVALHADDVPWPICFTASSSSAWRRPVMKT